MPDPLLYLLASGASLIVSAMVLLTFVVERRSAAASWHNARCIVAIGLGLLAGYCVLSPQLAWPPMNGLDRFLTIVIPTALGTELIAGLQFVPRWVGWFLRLGLAVSAPRILLHGSVYLSEASGEWTFWQAVAIVTVCGVLLVGVWGLLLELSNRSPGVSIPFSLCLSILCAGLTVMMAGYIKGGAAAFPLVATVLATTIGATLIARRTSGAVATAPPNDHCPPNFDASGIIGVATVGLFGLLMIGRFFGRLSTTCALLMLLAPLLCWATEIPLLRSCKPWVVGSLRLALVAIPLLAVLAVAKRDFDRDMAPLLGKSGGLVGWIAER